MWVACGGCGHGEATGASQPSAAPAAAPAATPAVVTLDQHMRLNFLLGLEARDAVVDADLPRAQRVGQDLADLDTSALPEDWRHFTKQLQHQAEELSMAPDLAAAAVAVAAIGGACGDCHYARHAKMEPWVAPPPEPDLPTQGAEDIDTRMKRHAVASDDLWAGLFVPSDAYWKRGADTLEAAPMRLPEKDGEPMKTELGFDVERVRDIARQARLAPAPQRPAVYGAFLAQCGTCHQQVAR